MADCAGTPRTILVANDHEWTARSLETILAAAGFTVIRAFTARQTVERAGQVRPDAFVLDVQLPDQDGITLCQALREDPRFGRGTPIIVTTAGPSGRGERLAAYRAGAWEFFGQPLDGETLMLKLEVFLGAKEVTDELRRESLLDATTQVYSHAGFVRRGREIAADAARRGRSLGLLLLQPTADAPGVEISVEDMARTIADLLRSAGRSTDAVGRVGPLEFALLAADVGQSELASLACRLNALAAKSPLSALNGGPSRPIFRSAVDIVHNPACEVVDPEEMLHRARTSADHPLHDGAVTAAS